MNRRTPCIRSVSGRSDALSDLLAVPGLDGRFTPGTFEVLDHHDIIEMLTRSKIISTQSFNLIDRISRCLAIVLLDAALVCTAVVTVNDVPDVFDDDVIATLSDVLKKLPAEISAIAFAICSPSDPSDDCDDVERLSTLCAPLRDAGIELRDIVECYPSGFSSLRADLIELEAERW
jgi:hypothetical protein